jgi:uncharacterized phage protein gp47/JayE
MASSGYFAPYIDAAGLHLPNYAQILADNIQIYQNIYGASVYLGPDSSDYQEISARSLKQSDTMQALQLVYNARSMLLAVGTDLDAIVKPVVRKGANFSTLPVTLGGTPNTVITNGQVQDNNGNTWNLPSPISIGAGGTTFTQATCTAAGPISSAPQNLIISGGGTAGWNTAVSTAVAALGTNVEADSSLRGRAVQSLAIPSQSRLSGTQSLIAALPGVTRLNCVENNTSAVDSLGNPPHSITCVVEGGVNQSIANVIYLNKTIGCYTNGTVSNTVVDPITGVIETINFDRPTYAPIYVTLNINPLYGYTSAITTAIQAAVVTYLNSLQIGENVTFSALYGAALSVMLNLSAPIFSITSLFSGLAPSPAGTTDIVLTFNQCAQGLTPNVVVNVL